MNRFASSCIHTLTPFFLSLSVFQVMRYLLRWLGLALAVTALCAEAAVHLVVDIDGSVEDYAALTTILRHSTARRQLALVTVSGTGYGSLKTTEWNVKRFLALAGVQNSVAVAIGSLRTLSEAYNASTFRADCTDTQGFPKTPFEALQRGMRMSRFDVDRCFGAAAALPVLPATALAQSSDATMAVVNMIGGLTDGEKLYYLSLSSLTNFAALLLRAREIGLMNNVLSSVELFIYENGNNLGVDPAATNVVLRQAGGLKVTVYAPQLWKTSVTFSFYNWDLFAKTASYASTSPEVKWLYAAWRGKKLQFDGTSTTATSFFKERGPASSLVTLCVVDTVTRAMCELYKGGNTTAMLTYSNSTAMVGSTPLVYDVLTGNNVTRSAFLQYPATVNSAPFGSPTAILQDGANQVFVVDTAANFKWPQRTQTLVDLFWQQWTSVLSK